MPFREIELVKRAEEEAFARIARAREEAGVRLERGRERAAAAAAADQAPVLLVMFCPTRDSLLVLSQNWLYNLLTQVILRQRCSLKSLL